MRARRRRRRRSCFDYFLRTLSVDGVPVRCKILGKIASLSSNVFGSGKQLLLASQVRRWRYVRASSWSALPTTSTRTRTLAGHWMRSSPFASSAWTSALAFWEHLNIRKRTGQVMAGLRQCGLQRGACEQAPYMTRSQLSFQLCDAYTLEAMMSCACLCFRDASWRRGRRAWSVMDRSERFLAMNANKRRFG